MFNTEGRTVLVDDNRAEGFTRIVGSLTGDAPTQARGKANQSAGEAQSMWGQVVDEVRDFISEQPFVALLSAVGLGAVVGFLTTRR